MFSQGQASWRPFIVECVVIGMLGVHGWWLLGNMPPSPETRDRKRTESNLRLNFTAGRGLGVHGELIGSSKDDPPKRVGAFLLRHASLGKDLAFWADVARLLPDTSGVRIVGYCDGQPCVEELQRISRPLNFPVIVYGEVVDSQVVLNADRQGAFVVSDKVERIPWRNVAQGPSAAVGRLLQ